MADTGDATNYFQKNPFFDKVINPFFGGDYFTKNEFFWQNFFGETHNGGGGTNPPPPVPDPIYDMDQDGLPDEVVDTGLNAEVSQDADSINIDTDGDGVADIVIPKKKKKSKKKSK